MGYGSSTPGSTSISSFPFCKTLFNINCRLSPSSRAHCLLNSSMALEAAAATAGLRSSANLWRKKNNEGYDIFLSKRSENILNPFTFNAPMPAFPRVHMEGAVARAFAKAFLQHKNLRVNDFTGGTQFKGTV